MRSLQVIGRRHRRQFTLHESWSKLKRYANLRQENTRQIPPAHRSSAAVDQKGLLPPPSLKRSALRSVRQTHDECQGDVESADVIVVEMSDLPSDSLAPNRHRFIGHHLRPHS